MCHVDMPTEYFIIFLTCRNHFRQATKNLYMKAKGLFVCLLNCNCTLGLPIYGGNRGILGVMTKLLARFTNFTLIFL